MMRPSSAPRTPADLVLNGHRVGWIAVTTIIIIMVVVVLRSPSTAVIVPPRLPPSVITIVIATTASIIIATIRIVSVVVAITSASPTFTPRRTRRSASSSSCWTSTGTAVTFRATTVLGVAPSPTAITAVSTGAPLTLKVRFRRRRRTVGGVPTVARRPAKRLTRLWRTGPLRVIISAETNERVATVCV